MSETTNAIEKNSTRITIAHLAITIVASLLTGLIVWFIALKGYSVEQASLRSDIEKLSREVAQLGDLDSGSDGHGSLVHRVNAVERDLRELPERINDDHRTLVNTEVENLVTQYFTGAKSFEVLTVRQLRANMVSIYTDLKDNTSRRADFGVSGKNSDPAVVLFRGDGTRALSLAASPEESALVLNGTNKFAMALSAAANGSRIRLGKEDRLAMVTPNSALGITLQYTEHNSDIYLLAPNTELGGAKVRMRTLDVGLVVDKSLVLNAGADPGWGRPWSGIYAASMMPLPQVTASVYVDNSGKGFAEIINPQNNDAPLWQVERQSE